MTAAVEAASNNLAVNISTRHLLSGILLARGTVAAGILTQNGVTYKAIQEFPVMVMEKSEQPMPEVPDFKWHPRQISPVFLLVLLGTAVTGYWAYLSGQVNSRFPVFLFVTGGWIVSLSLHEFGHALVAYLSGDRTVAGKGYLTLNPLKYTHGMLSIVYPLIFLIAGGIGLPGGAVYINRSLISGRVRHSLVSLAGPIATALLALLLVIPFILGIVAKSLVTHPVFWSGLAFLAFLEFTALLLNLLPIPGLDGFNALAPFLPYRVQAAMASLSRYAIFLLFILFWMDTPVQTWFWGAIWWTMDLFKVDGNLVGIGYELFRFWQ